jgi:hypothetical protein
VNSNREKAERLADYVRKLGSDFQIYTEIDGKYAHIGATIADAILQANRNYKLIVKPRVNRILRIYSDTQTTSSLVELLGHITIGEFMDYQSKIRAQRFKEVLDLLLREAVETTSDLRHWLTYPESVAKLRAINGVGPKTVDYLKILAGIPAVAIDRRLLKFLSMAGINSYSYVDAQDIIILTSDIMGYDRAHFDHSIWQYVETHHDNSQDPHPCRT